jgi:hypothetical protein
MLSKTNGPPGSPHASSRGRQPVRAAFAIATLGVALLSSGCGGSRSPAEDAAQQAAAANQRLSGTWMLVEFQPDVPLEPMLAQLLAVQIGHLTVQFDGARMSATGVGVQATRSYSVDSATDGQMHVTLVDETGVRYESTAAFEANLLRFHSLTMPWAGRGVLQRSAPAY